MGKYERLTADELAAALATLEAAPEIDADALKRALHELQVHQVELEMQNRELRETQELLEYSRNRYAQLYDESPVGYVTLNLAGMLEEVNMSAHQLLRGAAGGPVIGKALIDYVAPEDRSRFLSHLNRCRGARKRVTTELALRISWRGDVAVQLASVPDPHGAGVSRFLTAITDISERKAAEDELSRSESKLRELTFHVESLREAERTRIAREIHDELGAGLTGIKMELDWCLKTLAPRRLRKVSERLREAMRMADRAIASIRRICTDLRPSVLDHLGLAAALEWLARSVEESSGIRCELLNVTGTDDPDLTPECTTLLFRVAQEALTNAVRHSGASVVRIALRADPDGVGIHIQDNGRGFVPAQGAQPKSLGLLGMEERVRFAGGRFRLASAPGQGTTVEVSIPRCGARKGTEDELPQN